MGEIFKFKETLFSEMRKTNQTAADNKQALQIR